MLNWTVLLICENQTSFFYLFITCKSLQLSYFTGILHFTGTQIDAFIIDRIRKYSKIRKYWFTPSCLKKKTGNIMMRLALVSTWVETHPTSFLNYISYLIWMPKIFLVMKILDFDYTSYILASIMYNLLLNDIV